VLTLFAAFPVPSGTRLQIDDVFLQEPFADLVWLEAKS
jgi:hypothetical protein